MLIQLKVAHHQEGVLQRGLWCEATLTAEDPKRLFQYPDPEISRVWLFFKLNIANPSYYLKQLKVELLHYLFEFTRKLAHLSQSSGDEVGLFFPNPGREWWAWELTTPTTSATAGTLKCGSRWRQNVPVWL